MIFSDLFLTDFSLLFRFSFFFSAVGTAFFQPVFLLSVFSSTASSSVFVENMDTASFNFSLSLSNIFSCDWSAFNFLADFHALCISLFQYAFRFRNISCNLFFLLFKRHHHFRDGFLCSYICADIYNQAGVVFQFRFH